MFVFFSTDSINGFASSFSLNIQEPGVLVQAELRQVGVQHVGHHEGDGPHLLDGAGIAQWEVVDGRRVGHVGDDDEHVLLHECVLLVLARHIDEHGPVEAVVRQVDDDPVLGDHVVLVIHVYEPGLRGRYQEVWCLRST